MNKVRKTKKPFWTRKVILITAFCTLCVAGLIIGLVLGLKKKKRGPSSGGHSPGGAPPPPPLGPYLSLIYPGINSARGDSPADITLPYIRNMLDLQILYKTNKANGLVHWNIWSEYPLFSPSTQFSKLTPTYSVKYGDRLVGMWINNIPNSICINIFNPDHPSPPTPRGLAAPQSAEDFWTKVPPIPEYFEVTSSLPQQGPGNWLNHVKGTGMFYKAGKTLQARNKIQALFLLLGGVVATMPNPPMPLAGSASMTALTKMATAYPDFWWSGWGGRTHWTDEKHLDFLKNLQSSVPINTLQELFWNIINNGHLGRHISLEWINDCGVIAGQLTTLAQTQGYQTIWYYCQGYQHCWWNSEVQCVEANLNFQTLVSKYIRIMAAGTEPGHCVEFIARNTSYLHCFNWQGQCPSGSPGCPCPSGSPGCPCPSGSPGCPREGTTKK